MRRAFRLAALAFALLGSPQAASAAETSVDGPRTVRTDAAGEHRVMGGGPTDVAPDGTVQTVAVESFTTTVGKVTIVHSTCYADRTTPDGQTARRVLGRWNSAQFAPTTWQPHAARYTADGHFLSLLTVGGALWVLRDHAPWRRLTAKRSLAVAEARLLLDAHDEPLVFVRETLSYTLQFVAGVDRFETVLEGVDYDWSAARAATGELYVTGYDYADRTLVLATRAPAGPEAQAPTWRVQTLDSRESGWQHTLLASGDAVLVLTYYFRNAFNRGLNLIELRAGQVADRHTFLRLRDENGGWAPAAGALPGGRVFVSHRLREQADETSVETFESVDALRARRAEDVTGSWEDEYRDWSASVAVLPRYRFWSVISPQPASGDTPFQPDAQYDFDPAFELGGEVEGRIGSVDLGVSYLQAVATGRAAQSALFLAGFIGVDRLLLGHDLKVSSSFGRYRGTYRARSATEPADAPRTEGGATTPVTDIEVRLLNQWRLAYGLTYRRYRLPLPYYIYRAPAGELEYSFVGGDIADATVQRYEAFFGYSRIEYLTKYENSFHGLDLDVRGGVGLAVLDWPTAHFGRLSVDGTLDLALSAQARLGYVVYRRFHGLQGAGFFVRGGYEGAWQGSGLDNELPAPRDPEDSDVGSSAVTISVAHHQLFHGPYLSVGLVY